MDVVAELAAAEKARNEMLDHLTRAKAMVERAGTSGAVLEARRAIEVARSAAYVDGNGGPLPGLIVASVLAVCRLDLS